MVSSRFDLPAGLGIVGIVFSKVYYSHAQWLYLTAIFRALRVPKAVVVAKTLPILVSRH